MFGRRRHERMDSHLAGRTGFGEAFHLAYSWHPLPQAGAGQISYDTYIVPKYSPLGIGVAPRHTWTTRNPAFFALQGTLLNAIGAPGVIAGQFQSTALVTNDDSQNSLPPEVNAAMAMIGNNQLPGW